MFSFGKKKGPILGLDVNSDSITLMQLDKTRAGIEVARFACQPTPANTIREGLIADHGTIGNVVMDLMSVAEIPVSGPSPVVNVAVPAQAVVIRLMPIPTGMPPEELADVVTQEATNHVPFPIGDANLDWCLMPATERTDADGVRRVDVILAAIQRSIIESYWRMADSAGVKLGRVEISSLSVVRALALAGYLGSTGHLSMIVNIRQDATDINVVRSAMPLFGRSIILGLETLTESVSRSLDIHFDQAMDMLPEIPLSGPPADARMGQAAQIARTVFGDITDELVRSLEFYKSQVGDVKVDQVILTGPGCMVPGVDQFISNKMGIRTLIADPMRDMVVDPGIIGERLRPVLASLVGSSLETGWCPSFTVDLDLNKEGRLPLLYDERQTQRIVEEEEQAPWFKPVLLGGFVMSTVAILAWAYLTFYDLPNLHSEVEVIGQEVLKAKKQLAEISKLKQNNSALAKKKHVLDGVVKRPIAWSALLTSIKENTPNGVRIDKIISSGSDLKVEGSAQDFTSVSNFAINLGGSSLVTASSVEWANRNEKAPEEIEFCVSAQYDLRRASTSNVPLPPNTQSTPTTQPTQSLHRTSNATNPPAVKEPD